MTTAQPAKPGYWAVIPAVIRYDDQIPPNAKILYAEISSLIGAEGYCWATDDYFSQVFGFAPRTVRNLMASLKKAGYISVEEERGDHNVLLRRRVYAGLNPLAGAGPEASEPLAKICQGDAENGEPLAKTFQPLAKTFQTEAPIQYKIPSNNTNMPPISPAASDELDRLNPALRDMILTETGPDARLIEAWAAFAEMRRMKHTAISTRCTVERLIGKLRKLSGGDRDMQRRIIEQSVERCWTGVFALDDDEAPSEITRNQPSSPIPTGKDVIWV